jgi:hypothetical protein
MQERENIIIVTCQSCGQRIEYAVLNTIHSKVDAFEAQQVLRGEIFKARCERCDEEIQLLYETVFYDEDNDAAIYFVQEQNVAGVYTALRLTEELFAKDASIGKNIGNNPIVDASIKRIVSRPADLVEKAIIFSNGYDDRVVELVKLTCISKLSDKDPDFDVEEAFFDMQDGRPVVRLYGNGNETTALVPDALFDCMQEDFAEILVYDDEYCIDEEWALTAFEEYGDANGLM